MKKIKVIRLEGCKHCKKLIKELEERKIKFEALEAEDHSAYCDDLERILKTDLYPIVISESDLGNHYYYISNDNSLGTYTIDYSNRATATLNVESIIEIISKI